MELEKEHQLWTFADQSEQAGSRLLRRRERVSDGAQCEGTRLQPDLHSGYRNLQANSLEPGSQHRKNAGSCPCYRSFGRPDQAASDVGQFLRTAGGVWLDLNEDQYRKLGARARIIVRQFFFAVGKPHRPADAKLTGEATGHRSFVVRAPFAGSTTRKPPDTFHVGMVIGI